jgi:hypothetical protein
MGQSFDYDALQRGRELINVYEKKQPSINHKHQRW